MDVNPLLQKVGTCFGKLTDSLQKTPWWHGHQLMQTVSNEKLGLSADTLLTNAAVHGSGLILPTHPEKSVHKRPIADGSHFVQPRKGYAPGEDRLRC